MKSSITEVVTRYPNLVVTIQRIASANRSDACLAVWAYKNGIATVNAPRIAAFGTVQHLVSQVSRYRNI
ncbi:hypothetical protein [Spirosoma fluviale]|uniref:Uncharacterized protein n=1 Tax=Spirosoma fluviale TaxID=1597977 RepID=A0A286FCD3_9BACT|nr:hypothetical protein [Spirosoma fluviale]SOD80860.1 hypothetical protein SAMN06269250_1591 [Spirosoma fluviale]